MPPDPLEHFSKLQNLLKIEREEDRKQYLEKIRNRSIHDRCKEGVCWFPVIVKKSYLGLGEKWILEIERKSSNQRHLFSSGASSRLFSKSHDGERGSSGIINQVKENRIRIVLNQSEPPEWLDEGEMGLDLLFDESSYDEMEKVLVKLQGINEGREKELVNLFLGRSSPSFANEQRIKYPLLNSSQNDALNNALSSKDISLIHGPPGTGKTTTIVHCISKVIESEKQVLVCAPSNAAVDLLVEKLHKLDVNVVRLGHPARVNEEVISHTLDAQLANHRDASTLKGLRKKAEELYQLAGKYRRKYGRKEAEQRKLLYRESRLLKDEVRVLEDYIVTDILNKANVIACTLIGANQPLMMKRSFKTVFIDESSQALEPASWIPILKAKRVIMAGDHMQLPPTIKSQEAAKNGLEETLFERCMENYDVGVILRTQYRMHPDILAFSNKEFYGGQLVSDDTIIDRDSPFDEPVVFIDTAGAGYKEQINPETLSTYNVEEAQFTIEFLRKIIDGHPEQEFSIGIIAPYKAQIEEIQKANRHSEYHTADLNLSINTVDAFQGQERDIIIISLTRSNDDGEIGFLSNIKRMNVAMTRARHQLVIIGDSSTLCSHPFYDEMVQFFQKNDQYRSVFEYQYES